MEIGQSNDGENGPGARNDVSALPLPPVHVSPPATTKTGTGSRRASPYRLGKREARREVTVQVGHGCHLDVHATGGAIGKASEHEVEARRRDAARGPTGEAVSSARSVAAAEGQRARRTHLGASATFIVMSSVSGSPDPISGISGISSSDEAAASGTSASILSRSLETTDTMLVSEEQRAALHRLPLTKPALTPPPPPLCSWHVCGIRQRSGVRRETARAIHVT